MQRHTFIKVLSIISVYPEVSYLEMNGMLCFFHREYENKPFFIHKTLFQKLSDQFHQDSFEQINKEESKLRTYGVFKNKIGIEP